MADFLFTQTVESSACSLAQRSRSIHLKFAFKIHLQRKRNSNEILNFFRCGSLFGAS